MTIQTENPRLNSMNSLQILIVKTNNNYNTIDTKSMPFLGEFCAVLGASFCFLVNIKEKLNFAMERKKIYFSEIGSVFCSVNFIRLHFQNTLNRPLTQRQQRSNTSN